MTRATDAWDRLAELIEYPADGLYAARVATCAEAPAAPGAAAPLQRFRHAMAGGSLTTWQERYIEVFDFDPACTLNVGWHLLGDAPERGALLAALREDLAGAGVYERGELPDYLPTVLRLIARADEGAASKLADDIAPAVARVSERLHACGSPFAYVMDAVAITLAVLHRQEAQP